MNENKNIRMWETIVAATAPRWMALALVHTDDIKYKPIPRWPDRASYIRRKKGGAK